MQQSPYDTQPLTPRRNSTWIIVLSVGGGCLVVSLAIVAVLAAILFPVFAQARSAARRANSMSHGKQLAMSLMMYTQDYDNRLPPAAGWQNGLAPYNGDRMIYQCPERPGVVPAYAYNQLLDRRPLKQVLSGAQTPALFESSLGVQNAADQLGSFATPHRATGGQQAGIVAFMDGHVQTLPAAPKANAGLAPAQPAKRGKEGRRG